ncbi:hypothetical protein MKZ38_006875 [Zalerion maritima]|uniref:SAP domain-containing protein n=1 Tax=Zalerion maritima TaxID=339359 RepID=A0AAD5RIQ0_9PEZI|nr:hypothetical protein MKZ38_006875 [Zalerion maritima]
MTDWVKLKVADLRAQLKERGLPTTGIKAELVGRLNAADEEFQAQEEDEEDAQDNSTPEPEQKQDQAPNSEAEELPKSEDPPAEDATADDAAPDSSQNEAVPEPVPEVKLGVAESEQIAPAETEDGPVPESGPAGASKTEIPMAGAPDLARDAQKRKRRSASPPPSVHETKRTRVDDIAATDNDVAMDDMPSGVPEAKEEPKDDPKSVSEDEGPKIDPGGQSEDTSQDISPALHPATAALYIKNFMRPLHIPEFKEHLVELAAVPGAEPDEAAIVECYLDTIRTHALVQFSSTLAAQRVRASLHNTVFPKESNRKALWVDFIPVERVQEWKVREAQEPRGSSVRFEVAYDETDNETTARLVEIGGESNSGRPSTATEASAPQPPTGPRIHPGVEGAPLAPRADQQRGRGGPGMRAPRTNDPNIRTTRVDPMLYWKPIADELAQRRIENMRRFYNAEARITDDDKRNNINRYFFENGDNFVDRGKEIFAGIRPPHREREHRRMMREQRMQGGGSRLLDPTRRDRNTIPAPQSFRPGGGDRYMGSAARGDSWREGDSYSRRDDRRYRDYRGRAGRRR